MNNYLTYDIDKNGICFLKINRPPVNALSFELLYDLKSLINKLSSDNTLNVLIIGTDNKHFSAGADLKERRIMSIDDASEALDNFNDCFNAIEQFHKPVISALNGYCLGGGAELALSCDLRVGSNDCIIGFPEVSIGIIPGAGGTQRLPNIIGLSNSKYWILSAKKFTSKEAYNYGFLNFVTSNEDLHKQSIKLATRIAMNAPIALTSAKLSINDSILENCMIDKLKIERNYYNKCLNSKDRIEALDAFINKRQPKWENK